MRRAWAALSLAMVLPTALAWLYFVHLSPGPTGESMPGAHPTGPPNPLAVGAYVGAKVFQFALPGCWVWLIERRPTRPRRPDFVGIPTGLAFGLLVGCGTWLVYQVLSARGDLLGAAAERVRARVGEFGLDSPAKYALFAAFICTIHSLLEEYY